MNTTVSFSNVRTDNQTFVGFTISEGVRVTVLTLGWLACVSGVFGNVLIIITLLSQQVLRTVHNIYIANLALADLLVVGYVIVFWLLDLSLGHHPIVNQTHCHVNGFILVLTFTVSTYTLVLIAFNRYLSVCHSTMYGRLFNKKSTLGSCAALWPIAGFEASLPFFTSNSGSYIYKQRSHLCSFDTTDPRNVSSILSVINISLPVILVGIFSVSILRFWKKQKTRIGQWNQSTRQKAKIQITSSDISLIRSLILVFALLVILYIPLAVSMSIYRSVYVSPDVYAVILFFFFLNSSINWIVYGLMNKNFRTGYRRIFYRCYKGQLPPADGTEMTLNTIGTVR